MTSSRLAVLVLAASTAFLPGCGGGPKAPPMLAVSGTVEVDGVPLPAGQIIFVPLDQSSGPERGAIKDGTFECNSKFGKMRIEITAVRVTPHPGGGLPVRLNYIPARYNKESELIEEISESNRHWDFKLSEH